MGLADSEPASSLCLASGLVIEVCSKVTGKVRGSVGLGSQSVPFRNEILSGELDLQLALVLQVLEVCLGQSE